jgi:hypothetical protein
LEALWKHAAEKRCAIPTDRAQRGFACGIGKCRKLRKNSRFRVIVHGSFDTTHNLKVVGSNPTPATKSPSNIKDFNPEQNTGDMQARVYINATSTPTPDFDIRQHPTTPTNISRHKSPPRGGFRRL